MRRRRAAAPHPVARLAEMVRHVVEDYRAFAATVPEEADARAFVARHAACRAALAHLEHLLRLMRAIGAADGEAGAATREAALRQAEAALAEARSELARLPAAGEEEGGEAPDGEDAPA
ncbi:hypothetical protein [Caldovatus aquaticus]|uniref:Uncharacterized protein n=1 Tax=Caldovatus aquaticus TaxID=2865671 RepID=A0ABS7F6Z9_9PROT|nr:hypothetical protein [Caldovatus aquaticus]MBW8271334.1 hypothetical protein [Caldovatus aquaticus]